MNDVMKYLSTSDKIKMVQWRKIEPDMDEIYFETHQISEEIANSLRLIFEKLLISQFKCNYTHYANGYFSTTISIVENNQYWANLAKDSPSQKIEYWAENINALFFNQ